MMKLQQIILIDDDAIINFVHNSLIKSLDLAHEVTVFEQAKDALTYLSASSEERSGDTRLLLLDINMPGMNGWEFLDAFISASLHEKTGLYICIVSSSISQEDRKRAADYGIVRQFISKPLNRENLTDLVDGMTKNM